MVALARQLFISPGKARTASGERPSGAEGANRVRGRLRVRSVLRRPLASMEFTPDVIGARLAPRAVEREWLA